MSVLAENAVLEQPLTHLARARGDWIDVEAEPQADLPDLGDGGERPATQSLGDLRPEPGRVFGEGAVLEQRDHLAGDRARERVAAERAPVLTRAEHAEDAFVGRDRGYGHDPAAERLAEDVDIRCDRLVVDGEAFAGPPETRLHLVGDEEDVVCVTDRPDRGKVAGRRDDHAGLTLDRLDEERDRMLVDRRLERVRVPERDRAEPGGIGTEAAARDRVA